jgi:hypothetical protein
MTQVNSTSKKNAKHTSHDSHGQGFALGGAEKVAATLHADLLSSASSSSGADQGGSSAGSAEPSHYFAARVHESHHACVGA